MVDRARRPSIAAAGGHHTLFIASLSTAPTVWARALAALLPDPTEGEALDIASVHSAAGIGGFASRPWRAPHHTASAMGLVGGGDPPRPGEIALADGGVLFLDGLAEFPREGTAAVADALRDRAVALGWPIDRIHVIDSDQGVSGAQAAGRDGFQHLVTEVAMGHAGIVLGLVLLLTFVLSGHGLGASGAANDLVAGVGLQVAPEAIKANGYLGPQVADGSPLGSWMTWEIVGVAIGALIGAFAFALLQELFKSEAVWGALARHWNLGLGLTIIASVALLPRGLVGLPQRWREALLGRSPRGSAEAAR